jgi:hypothetical protein
MSLPLSDMIKANWWQVPLGMPQDRSQPPLLSDSDRILVLGLEAVYDGLGIDVDRLANIHGLQEFLGCGYISVTFAPSLGAND